MTLAEVEITAELVRDLLRDQHPDLADHHLSLGARGWDNQLWRLGEDLAVRLPWATESADVLLRKEYAWLPSLAPSLPLPVPVPQRLGEPSERFPATLDRHHLGAGHTGRSRPRHTCRGRGRQLGRVPLCPSPACPRRGAGRPWARRATS